MPTTATIVSAAAITPSFPHDNGTRLRNRIAKEALSAGNPVYLDATTGKVGIAKAGTAGKKQFRGIVLRDTAADAAVSILESGECSGFDLSGFNYDQKVYLADDGTLSDTAGTTTVCVGRVTALTDLGTRTKVLRIESQTLTDW